MAPLDNNSLLFKPAGVQRIQQATGTLLFYVRTMDSIMHVALDSIAFQQLQATKQIED